MKEMKKEEMSTEIKYYGVVKSYGVRRILRNGAFGEIYKAVFNIANEKGISPYQVNKIKSLIETILYNNMICAEIEDYVGHGGHHFIKCHGVCLHLMPFEVCSIK